MLPITPIIQTMGLTEAEFRTYCDAALDRLNRALDIVAERYDAEILFQNGVLSIAVEEPNPGKIVISPADGPKAGSMFHRWMEVQMTRPTSRVVSLSTVRRSNSHSRRPAGHPQDDRPICTTYREN